MALTIVKTTFTFTVLHRADEPLEGIEHALAESYDGHAVGLETSAVTVGVPDNAVCDELIALNNDGEFFDIDLERESA